MIRNLTRFTNQMVQDKEQSVGVWHISSLVEMMALVDLSIELTYPFIISFDDQIEDIPYTLETTSRYIEQKGALVGIGYRTSSSDKAIQSIQAGSMFLQFDIRNIPKAQAKTELAYLSKLIHADGGIIEVIVGEFEDGEWKSNHVDEFSVELFVLDNKVDSLGFVVSEEVTGDFRRRGKAQIHGEFLHLMAQSSQLPLGLHGAPLGSQSVKGLMKGLRHSYLAVEGISEHGLMNCMERGVRYIHLDIDLRYLYDLSYRKCFSQNQDTVTLAESEKKYKQFLGKFMKYVQEMLSHHYKLS